MEGQGVRWVTQGAQPLSNVVDGDHATMQETMLYNTERIRDLQSGPDGLIYIVTDSGEFARLVPAGEQGA